MTAINIGEFSEALNDKADRDLQNIDDTGFITMAKASMPSNTYVSLTLGESGTTYTAPSDGYVWVAGTQTGGSGYLFLGNSNNGMECVSQPTNVSSYEVRGIIPVAKGQYFYLFYGSVNITYFRFIYAVGSESEAP